MHWFQTDLDLVTRGLNMAKVTQRRPEKALAGEPLVNTAHMHVHSYFSIVHVVYMYIAMFMYIVCACTCVCYSEV